MKKILIIGMSGNVGGILRRHLESLGTYELTALNRRPVDGVECHQADIADLEAIVPAFEGKDVVVNLATQAPDEPWEGLLRTNVIGAYNVYEAARLAGVKRVVYISSGNTMGRYEFVPPYDAIVAGRYEEVPENFPKITHEAVWPLRLYGVSKLWGETLGHHFADTHGLSVLCVRIGVVRPEDHPRNVREFSLYLSHLDLGQILEKCIEAPEDLLYDVFFATSNNKWGYRDLEHPRKVLGYEPQDSADAFR